MKKTKTNTTTYQDALAELMALQQEMENNQIPIDELDVAVQRATELLAFCKEKLRKIETNIAETIKKS
jgi:exodeoxyribonuclease VII small subunit